MTEQDRKAMESLILGEYCPYCDGVGGRTGPGGFMHCNHCNGTGTWWSDEVREVWRAACAYKDRQHAEEIAEAQEIIDDLSGFCKARDCYPMKRRAAEAWLNAHPEEDRMNNTSIKFYNLTNDETGKIVLTPAGEIPNKPARSRELVAEIDRLKKIITEQDALLKEAEEIVTRHALLHRSRHAYDLANRIRRRAEVEPDSAEEDV